MTHTVVGNTEENAAPWHDCTPPFSRDHNIGALIQCDTCGKLWVITKYTPVGANLTMWYRPANGSDKRKARRLARKAGRGLPDFLIGRHDVT